MLLEVRTHWCRIEQEKKMHFPQLPRVLCWHVTAILCNSNLVLTAAHSETL